MPRRPAPPAAEGGASKWKTAIDDDKPDPPATQASDPSPDPAASTAPSSAPATNYGTAGAGDCADGGDSCMADPAEVAAKADCAPDGQHHRACLCAGAILFQCFINHGCYTPRIETALTLEYLQKNVDDNNKGAAEFGAPCF